MKTTMRGFTLVELMITIAVIAVLASMAIPNLVSARAVASEKVVIATLRTITSSQMQFRISTNVDRDFDGIGEHGSLGELSGQDVVRTLGRPLDPNLFSLQLGDIDPNGYARRSGYHFAMYLPDNSGAGIIATQANLPNVDRDYAENYWSCLAWPVEQSFSARPTYFANQQGQIMKCANGGYWGVTNPPAAGCALEGSNANLIITHALAANSTGSDGNLWTVVN